MSKFLYLIPLFPLLGFLFNFLVGVGWRGRRARALARGPAAAHRQGHGHGADDAHVAAPAVPADPGHGAHGTPDAHDAHAAPSPLVGIVACGAVLLSFLVSVYAVWRAHAAPDHTIVERLWSWIPGGAAQAAGGTRPFQVDWAYQLDPLSSVMILVVTFVGFFIHVYSLGYMKHDAGYARYMSYLNLFMFAMLTLVLGANYLVLFVGWEGVGLCSYLLIGFWFHKQSASDAGKKAFIVNRIGDAGFALGMFLIFFTFGTLDFRPVAAAAARMPVETGWSGPLTLIALFLFIGACGKSAQIPLYVWLPDAMEGPTPVSALIHAATMVTAGVYMVARSSSIYAHAPNALFVVALVGALTAVMAATIALVQNDIKRVLAYSTVSQLGYMFLACGVGAFAAGVFHLMTHAFFKALLFLGSGSVIHAMGGEQDMRRMGGLKEALPWTRRTMLVGCIAIAGVPPLAGFFSKDEILWSAFKVGGYGQVVWIMGFVVAALTAFYMFRMYHLTFGGTFRGTEEQAHHLHESPASMVIPLQVLAVGSIVAGLIGIPAVLGEALHIPNVFEHFLHPVFADAHHTLEQVFTRPVPGHGVELALMAASVLVGAAGILVAWLFFRRHPEIPGRIAGRLAGVHRLLSNKYYVDEAYDAVFVRGAALGGGRLLHASDRYVVDGGDGEVRAGLGVNGIAWATRDLIAKLSDFWDRWIVDGILARLTAAVLDNGSYVFRAMQNGLVQHYALVMLIGVFLIIGAGRFLLGLY
jgi:NADH-quinone oxidoreductase subunit L